jgi:hypothetical protein
MKTIWKWKLGPETTINMPHGAKLLAVQDQNGEPHLWAMVDPSAKTYPRTFRVYGTGHNMPDEPGQYVGTVQMREWAMVVHVFEANGPIRSKNASGQRIFEPYNGIPCTCTEQCHDPCKGGCGCKACRTSYQDFLSKE